ncbi:MAG: hypothetical protein ABSC06_20125 [Rhodopila sp.]|jgi:hypothetical protein
MTPDHFRACLDQIGWSQRSLAAMLQIDERQVRRMAAGAAIPEPIATWLDTLARFHESHPPPARPARSGDAPTAGIVLAT